jgi:hypothetical protein
MANYQNTIPNQLAQGAIGTGLSTLYTTPAGTRTYVKDIDVSNAAAVAVSLWIYLVAAGGTAGAGNILVPGILVPASGMFQWSGTQVLLPGQTIQALAGAPGLSLIASGGEAT